MFRIASLLLLLFATTVMSAEVDRSPVDLALDGNGAWLITANQTSNTASLVRISDGQILDEISVGIRPAAIALCGDGSRALVTGNYSGDVTMLEVVGDRLRSIATIHVGFDPVGVAVSPNGKTAYVALTAAGQVAVLDLDKRVVISHIEVGQWPRYLALSPDGSRLAVGISGDRGVAVIDTKLGQQLYVVNKFKGLNVGQMQVSADGQTVYFPWMHYGENLPSRGNIRRGWVLGNRVARVRLDGLALREAFSLDKEGKAVGDAHALALSRDERWMAVSASGTHELLLLAMPGLKYSKIGGTEHIDPELFADPKRFARVSLGGRPMGLRFGKDDRTVFVANYLDNSVQVVDIDSQSVLRTFNIGATSEPSLARRGEKIFFDAQRSFDQWYSCHSCHYEGGGNSEVIDTLNDGTSYTYKTVPPLYGVLETGPWTWHGWQKDLAAAMHKSLTTTMLGQPPNQQDVEELMAYFKTLRAPPNPYRMSDGSMSDAALRGKRIFHSETAACANCHNGPYFTDGEIHDVGLGSSRDRYKGFNTPGLLGVYRKVRLLHDGRSRSLEQLLTEHHSPANVTGLGELTDQQRNDLIKYLKSL